MTSKILSFFRSPFSLIEDIILLEKSLEEGTKWSKILKKFEGRNQHQIKNRFIFILSQINDISKEKIRHMIKNPIELSSVITISLDFLKAEQKTLLTFSNDTVSDDDYLETISMVSSNEIKEIPEFFQKI